MSRKVWPGTRARVYERDGYTCSYCGKQCVEAKENRSRKMGDVATVDHVTPRSQGGGSGADNLVTACFTCNTQKHRRTAEQYRDWLAQRVIA